MKQMNFLNRLGFFFKSIPWNISKPNKDFSDNAKGIIPNALNDAGQFKKTAFAVPPKTDKSFNHKGNEGLIKKALQTSGNIKSSLDNAKNFKK